jgi:hypothetical protein
MEPERGDAAAELLVWGATGAGSNSDAGAACLCPAAVAGTTGGSAFPRHALEQEMLRRGELQLQGGGGGGGGDRRRERKMKNRESAARSRARRYAYVNDLEKEVSLLRSENEELKKLCEEVSAACVCSSSSVRVLDKAGTAASLFHSLILTSSRNVCTARAAEEGGSGGDGAGEEAGSPAPAEDVVGDILARLLLAASIIGRPACVYHLSVGPVLVHC